MGSTMTMLLSMSTDFERFLGIYNEARDIARMDSKLF